MHFSLLLLLKNIYMYKGLSLVEVMLSPISQGIITLFMAHLFLSVVCFMSLDSPNSSRNVIYKDSYSKIK